MQHTRTFLILCFLAGLVGMAHFLSQPARPSSPWEGELARGLTLNRGMFAPNRVEVDRIHSSQASLRLQICLRAHPPSLSEQIFVTLLRINQVWRDHPETSEIQLGLQLRCSDIAYPKAQFLGIRKDNFFKWAGMGLSVGEFRWDENSKRRVPNCDHQTLTFWRNRIHAILESERFGHQLGDTFWLSFPASAYSVLWESSPNGPALEELLDKDLRWPSPPSSLALMRAQEFGLMSFRRRGRLEKWWTQSTESFQAQLNRLEKQQVWADLGWQTQPEP